MCNNVLKQGRHACAFHYVKKKKNDFYLVILLLTFAFKML